LQNRTESFQKPVSIGIVFILSWAIIEVAAVKQVELSEIPLCGGRCCFAIVVYAKRHLKQKMWWSS
jgi:hypothetical protein